MREVYVDRLSPDTVEQWWDQLDNDERKRASRLVSDERRKEVVAAHGVLRDLAGDIAHVAPKTFRLIRGVYGQKPSLLSDPGRKLDVNLTHCAAFAACVVSEECDVGIDAEDLRRPLRASELLPHFAQEEQQWLKSLPLSRVDRASLQLWSLKEAAVKAIGRGLSIDLAAFALLPKGRGLSRKPNILGEAERWRFWQYYPTERHVVSIAARVPQIIV